MAELRTEEEQLQAIKNWWKDNGRSTIFGVLMAVVIVLGWRGWQQHEQATAEQASALYQNLMSAVSQQPGQTLNDEQRKTAEHLAGRLKTEFDGLAYAQYAALWLAKDAVLGGDLAKAQSELEWVLAHKPTAALASIAQLRLARVLLARDQPEQALASLEGGAAAGFEESYYEVKGDIYKVMGRLEEARAAYGKGLASPQGAQRPILTIKRDDLAVEES